jgi:hypothetical protein
VEPSERQRGFALPDPAVRQKEVLTFLQRFLALAPQSSHAAEVRDLIVRVKAEIEARAK